MVQFFIYLYSIISIYHIHPGSLPVDTIIPKHLYEKEHDEIDDLEDADDRSQMTKLKKAAAAIEQARQSKLKKGKNKR